MRISNPTVAKNAEKLFLKRNEYDDLVEGKNDNDFGDLDEIVKIYPGSPKGPLPTDDPEHYGEWFLRNQPEILNQEGPDKDNNHEIG